MGGGSSWGKRTFLGNMFLVQLWSIDLVAQESPENAETLGHVLILAAKTLVGLHRI